jgi:hypothetical protein
LLCACPGPRHPTPVVKPSTVAVGRDGATLTGVAANEDRAFFALTANGSTTIDGVSWHKDVAGQGGPLAAGASLYVSLGGKQAAGLELRGEPGAAIVALDPASGNEKWKLAVDSSEWSIIAALAPTKAGVFVAGSFSGTLRAGAKTVSSAGGSDGFIARLDDAGNVVWLERVGGPNPDAIQGVAARGDRLAITGTFGAGADLLGEKLISYDDKTPRADGFVAELDPNSGARRWSQSFGGKLDDSAVGIAIDGKGRVAVAASAREVIKIGSAEVVAVGDGDGVLSYWSSDGSPGHTIQLGGADFDGVRAIAAVGNKIVVGGFFSGTIRIGQRKLTAGGGDDAYIAAFDNGNVTDLWAVTGEGREEVAALAAMPGGVVAAVRYTARATIEGGEPLPAPKDPASGSALVIRPVR